jgi:HEPN domain-containing protein
MADRSRDWMAQALDDLESAGILRDHGKHAQACFMAQQAAEKALKAALYSRLRESRTHALLLLVGDLDDKAPETAVQAARVLDLYYIPTRYANGHDSGAPFSYYGAPESKQAVEYADLLIEFARSRMAQSR